MKQFLVRFWSNYDNLCVSLAWPLSAVSRHYYVTEDQEGSPRPSELGIKCYSRPREIDLGVRSQTLQITDLIYGEDTPSHWKYTFYFHRLLKQK